jgi:chromosome partitioning protein
VTELWAYISDRLEKNFRRTVFSAPTAMQHPGFGARPQAGGGGFGRRVMS